MRRQSGFTLIELLLVVAIIGIIAAIGIPSLLRARVSANESANIGDVRNVLSAEAGFFSASEGYYGVLTCLSTPSDADCLPSYPPNAPTFLDSSIATTNAKSGYSRTLQVAQPGPEAGLFSNFCYTATPIVVGQTGVRSFGGDNSGTVGAGDGNIDCCNNAAMLDTLCPGIK